jgi:hypothetical protein
MEEVVNCIAAYLRDMSIFDSQSKGPELYGHKSKGMSIMGNSNIPGISYEEENRKVSIVW